MNIKNKYVGFKKNIKKRILIFYYNIRSYILLGIGYFCQMDSTLLILVCYA